MKSVERFRNSLSLGFMSCICFTRPYVSSNRGYLTIDMALPSLNHRRASDTWLTIKQALQVTNETFFKTLRGLRMNRGLIAYHRKQPPEPASSHLRVCRHIQNQEEPYLLHVYTAGWVYTTAPRVTVILNDFMAKHSAHRGVAFGDTTRGGRGRGRNSRLHVSKYISFFNLALALRGEYHVLQLDACSRARRSPVRGKNS